MANLNKIRIQLRNDITTNWEEKNPTLLKGELAFDQSTKYIKIGDGQKAWKDLPVVRLPKTAIDDLKDVNTNTIYKLTASEDGMKFQLLSADGTLDEASQTWTQVQEVSAKDWAQAIKDAQDAATKAGEDAAAAVEAQLTGYVKYADVKSTVSESNKVVTEKDIEALTNVMHFLGTVTPNDGESDAAAAVRTFADAKKGDVVISTKTSKEYVYVGDEAGVEANWREFGDESSYATKTALEDEKTAREAADTGLSTAVGEVKTDLTAKYNELVAVDTAISGALETFKTTVADTYATKGELTTAENALKAVDTALSGAIDTLAGKALTGVQLNGNDFSVKDGVASFTFDTIECGGAE